MSEKKEDFNPVEELIFTASIYARTRYQLKECKLSQAEQIKFMREIKDSNIITNALTMLMSIMMDRRYKDVESVIGDIRNKNVSDESMNKVLNHIIKSGETLM